MQMSEEGTQLQETVPAPPKFSLNQLASQAAQPSRKKRSGVYTHGGLTHKSYQNNKRLAGTEAANTSTMLPPAVPAKGNAGQAPNKRLLSNAITRRGVRGELLTNGYKSLRAQGMLRAIKVDTHGDSSMQRSIGKRKGSQQDLEHVNICIEQTQPAEITSEPQPRSDAVPKRALSNTVISGSPSKPATKLLPSGMQPSRDKTYKPLKNSRTSKVMTSAQQQRTLSNESARNPSMGATVKVDRDGVVKMVESSEHEFPAHSSQQDKDVSTCKRESRSAINVAESDATTNPVQISQHIIELTEQ